MNKRYKTTLLIASVFAIFTACNQKYELDVNDISNNSDKNITKISKEQKTEQNTTKQIIKPTQDIVVVKKPIKTKTELVVETKEIKPTKIETKTINNIDPKPTKIVQKDYYPTKVLKRTSSIATKETISKFDFDIIKKGFKSDNTLLIVGGIQGDEPGGFMAASLIATHYKITKGSVWIIPNLNFYSIIKRSRGPYGDMNRKFANLSVNDPEYETVQRIKGYIKKDDIKLIVNLHDGSGFYRPTFEDKNHSQYKWGQCSIIDQDKINAKKYSNLKQISDQIVKHVNQNALDKEHIYHTHNTRTSEGDKEMEKTLTYYAIKNGKAAFGNEASKSLPTHQRIYYHLLALEKYMQVMGIEYERKFNLNDQVIKNIIDNDIEIALYDNKIKLPLAQIRNILRYFPVKKDGTIDFVPSNPLMSIVKERNEYTIYYGNRRLSKLKADFVEHSKDQKDIKLLVDDKIQNVKFGDTIKVKKDILLYPIDKYRINVIGYTNKTKIETDVKISLKKMLKRFSIDKQGLTYRAEFYTNKKFVGMILIEFMDK
ncbi:MAG: M99 family carboxypeptidase catalytic domain-containing protein [Campylobacterota bacterium]|nr:M99 family carboxypeptidase catalytic domain-containing protein [Campylobacterota bacterium]